MAWSFSESKQFERCQRQWFYRYRFANSRATKEPLRKEAYLLSKLNSVFAWRGKIVDKTISDFIVRPIRFGGALHRDYILKRAHELFELQLSFARAHRVREPDILLSDTGDDFAAFREVEYDGLVDDSLIEQAWGDVQTALSNLLSMKSLIDTLRVAKLLIDQRRLHFFLYGLPPKPISVVARPDLIAFYNDRPPLIVDWKVHSFGRVDYRLQLACYALALTRCRPHKDFSDLATDWAPTDLDLLEVQLLTNQQRRYQLTEDDVNEIESYIAETATVMGLALNNIDGEPIEPRDFPVTQFPGVCASCSFQKICWDEKWPEETPPESRQMSLFSGT